MQLQLPASLDPALLGIGGATLQIAVGHFLAVALGCTSSPLRAIGRWLIDLLPGLMVDVSIALLEGADKVALWWTLVLLWLSGAGLASAAFGPGAAATGLALVGALGLVASLRRPELPRLQAVVVATTAAVLGPMAVLLWSPPTAFVLAASSVLAASALKAVRRRSSALQAVNLPVPATPLGEPSPGTRLVVDGLSPLLTPTDRFYVTDVTFPPPRIDPHTWSLEVTGLVDRPLRLTLAELLAMEPVEVDATLVCVHNPVGGDRIGTARWQGVPLAALLERVGVSPGADHVLARSVDGYSGGLPLSLLDQGFEPLVVYAMNGERLRPDHGAPVRLLVPGIYGYDANVKWLRSLELTRFELARDYWERKGWPRDPARVKTQSRIDVPGPAAVVGPGTQVVAGVAWSPPHGVCRVEIRVDEGPWQACELASELSRSAWRQWQFRWNPSPGRHTLQVRAWSPHGVQEDGDGAPFPRGAAGHHLVSVTVAETTSAVRPDGLGVLAALVRGRLHLARVGARAWRSRTSDT